MNNEDTLEHKIKSVDQNLDDKFELVIEEANTLRKNIAESIQANNKSLELFENAIETMIGVNESLWKELKIGDEFIGKNDGSFRPSKKIFFEKRPNQ